MNSDGSNVGAIIFNAAKAFVPLLSIAFPLVGLVSGLVLSLFDPTSESSQLRDLSNAILKEVADMISGALVAENIRDAGNEIDKIAQIIWDSPQYLLDHPDESKDGYNKHDFFRHFESLHEQYVGGFAKVFGQCVKPGTKVPQYLDGDCQKFCAAGQFVQQLHFAQGHLSSYMSAAQFALDNKTARYKVSALEEHRVIYADFLAVSLTNWLDHVEKPVCHYDTPKGWGETEMVPDGYGGYTRMSSCRKCEAPLNKAEATFKVINKTVPEITGCEAKCIGAEASNQPKDLCGPSGARGCPKVCKEEHFDAVVDQWTKTTISEMTPLVRGFQVTFTSEKDAAGKGVDLSIGPYSVVQSVNASTCQMSCRNDLKCRGFEFDGLDPNTKQLNYSSMQTGLCSLFGGAVKGEGEQCKTSDDCGSFMHCYSTTPPTCVATKKHLDIDYIPRTRGVDDRKACNTSDQCAWIGSLCFPPQPGGKARAPVCMSQEYCAKCNTPQGCGLGNFQCAQPIMPPTTLYNFTKMMGQQYCVNYTAYARHKFTSKDEKTDEKKRREACSKLCGPTCNAVVMQKDDCVVYENCVPSVLWAAWAGEYYMKVLPMKEKDGVAAVQVVHTGNATHL